MCGISGIVYLDKSRIVPEALLTSMRDIMVHRGPDDCGTFIDGNVGLAHRRLSIIDVAGGRQPMTNEDGTIWIVFNGEIYNFKDIRKGLLQRGHVFRTNSDTEVIVHLFEEKDVDCAAELNGIFAFAVYDKRTRRLILARDHMGIKPLYYSVGDGAFLFSSEIKSILTTGLVEGRTNNKSLSEYFLFRNVTGEDTLFQGVKSLLPAHTMIVEEGAIHKKEFWSPLAGNLEPNGDHDTLVENLSWLVQDSVRGQLISDVPLGTFCSGGVDSSLVTALAARFKGEAINTFSVGFHETEYDETNYARLVSKQFKTNHHEVRLNNQEYADLLPKLAWHNDEPLNFANSIQIYAISKLAKEHVTVVLTGEGADELFCGYPRYRIPKFAAMIRKFPSFARSFLGSDLLNSLDHRFRKIARLAEYPSRDLLIMNSAFISTGALGDLLTGDYMNGFGYRAQCVMAAAEKGLDPINQMSFLDQKTYLVSILMRQDKMSMACSIESRVPLLDYRIVELANKIPSYYKTRGFKTKTIFKTVASQFLPPEIINRRKSGFGVPLGQWFRESKGLGELAMDSVADIKDGDVIDKKFMEKTLLAHKQGEDDHSELLWSFISFALWRKAFAVGF
jgi:asparagine synthase (glutamine-hydrolysing)